MVKDNQGLSDFYQNDEFIPQKVQQTFFSIGNKLSQVIKIKESYYQLNSFLEYTRTPEQLSFTGGPLAKLQAEYERVVQNTLQQQLKGYIGTSIIKKWHAYTLDTKFSFNYQYKTLFSYPQDNIENNQEEASNDLSYTHWIPKISPNFRYEKNGLSFYFTPHISFQSRTLNDLVLKSTDQVNQFVFEPSTHIRYKYRNFTLDNSYTFQNNFSELPQMYSGIIIKDFRTAHQLPLSILSTQSYAFSSTLAYDNPSSALSAKAQYRFNSNSKDWINQYDINEDGVALIKTSNFNNNKGTSHLVSGNFHWFILDLVTNVRSKVTMNTSNENVIVNETTNQNTTTSLAWEGMIDFPIVKELIFTTYYNSNYTKNSLEELEPADWNQKIWGVDIEFNKKKHQFKWHNKWIEHTFIEDEFLYLDFSYQYKFNQKTFVRFTAQNLLNNRNYTQANFDPYFSQQTYYLLRPRQLMVTVRFKL
ncbi:hypothetical protein V6R21_03010 [Limibacter armeniacum]|uniref:hypothetical protein n=1 Tax=Limibacter armeniacum TaxID=466084 RepID=UPI002FE5C9FA